MREEETVSAIGDNQLSMADRVIGMTKRLRHEVPSCLATGVVDMTTGMLLTYETTEGHPSEVLDMLAGATLDMFQGRTVTMIEDIFKERRGVTSNEHYFQEILANSTNLTHLFIRNNQVDDLVAVVVCPKSVIVGMLMVTARRVIKEYSAA